MTKADNRAASLAALLLCLLPTLAVSAPQEPAAHSASARFSHDHQVTFAVEDQPNRISASRAVTTNCQEALRLQPGPGYCELTRLDQAQLVTAEELSRNLPTDRPLYLWRFSTATTTVYVGGSVHILKSGLPIPEQYFAALAAADRLVLEVDLNRIAPEQLVATLLRHATLPDNPSGAPAPHPAGLEAALNAYGLTADQFTGFKPAYVSQQLGLAALLALGYTPALGVENQILARADEQTVLQLETLETQMALMFDQPLSLQRAVLDDTLDQLHETGPVYAELLRAWLTGDDGTFSDALNRQGETSAELADFMRQMTVDRNHHMSEAIDQYFSQSGTYLVIIGTGHLVGEDNVIELLRRRGHKPQRIFADEPV